MTVHTAERSTEVPPPHILNAQVLGEQELAQFLGVRRSTVHAWSSRRNKELRDGNPDYAEWHLATPDYPTVNGTKAWRRLTIIKWAARTGRLETAPWLHEEAAPWVPEDGPKRWKWVHRERLGALVGVSA